MSNKTKIIVETKINSPVEKVWSYYTQPEHIVNWNFASDDWCCPKAENNLRVGEKFSWRMEAKDKSNGFDFEGIYTEIIPLKKIAYRLLDDRDAEIIFNSVDNQTEVIITFEAENVFPIEMQKAGWQAILNNFKKYVELQNYPILNKLQFSIEINAPASIVYNKMLGLNDIKTYQLWTSEFNPTSTYEGGWQKGSEIHFIGTEQNGKKGGMVSRIAENIPSKFVSIQHIGILDGERVIKEGKDVEAWSGAFENYYFEDLGGKTLLKIEMDSNDEFKDYFTSTWPKALAKLKEICEGQ